jgi:hypothetical protein
LEKINKNLIFVDTNSNLGSLDISKEQLSSKIVFSFNIHTHKELEEKGISHKVAEDFLSLDDHQKVFDQTVSFWNWYEKNEIFKKLEFENTNLLSVFDTAELHQIIIRELYVFLAMKRILEKYQPQKIITSNHFGTMLKSLTANTDIKIETTIESTHEFSIPWNQFLIKFNLGKIPLSLRISRNSYDRIRNLLESFIGKIFNLWPDKKNTSKLILFVEFDPSQYPKLIEQLSHHGNKLLFLNRRRTAIWNMKSLKLLQKYHCKITSPHNLLTNNEIINCQKSSDDLLKKIEEIWSNERKTLEQIFSIENHSFWLSINDALLETFRSRMHEYALLIKFSKKLLQTFNLKSIVTLNTMGETEKTILNQNKNEINSILLEHGASDYLPKISRYDVTSGYRNFTDKIAVWSQYQKDYLINVRGISEERIFVTGSPRHDSFFDVIKHEKNSQKTILITIPAIPEMNFISDTNSYIELEHLLKKLFSIIKNLERVNLIVKLHPVQDTNNEYIKKLIHKLEPNILILQTGSIKEIISSCDAMINLHVELMPSTVLLEGLILKKPIMNIVMTNEILEFQYVKDNAVLSVTDNSNLENSINELLNDENISKELIKNGQLHIKNFLANPGNASKSLADVINSM